MLSKRALSKNQNKKTIRLDQHLVESQLVSSLARAQAMILAGHVLVEDVPQTKAGTLISREAKIRLKEAENKYVSRGALKLKAALSQFDVDVTGAIAIDVGSSTGGFTEILLENGAKKVFAIDSGTNQLAWKIRSDPRVIVHENYNARNLNAQDFPEVCDIVVMDVSFISIRLILPAVFSMTTSASHWIVLFKPQFELERDLVGEGGIVRDQNDAKQALAATIEWAQKQGLRCLGHMDSPILGAEGNHEYLIHWVKEN
jgi:23S rRNA (cytidine1920-2'-O)/16S rRNA (cytidine1409-2'-O)-methyltransferase